MLTIPISAELDARLDNWVRWLRSGGAGNGSCGSAEGRYRPKRDDERTLEWRERVDVADAELVERVVCALPHREKKLISGWFYWKKPAPVCCQHAGLHWLGTNGFTARMIGACALLEMRLEQAEAPVRAAV